MKVTFLMYAAIHFCANLLAILKVCVRGEMDQIIIRSFKQKKAR